MNVIAARTQHCISYPDSFVLHDVQRHTRCARPDADVAAVVIDVCARSGPLRTAAAPTRSGLHGSVRKHKAAAARTNLAGDVELVSWCRRADADVAARGEARQFTKRTEVARANNEVTRKLARRLIREDSGQPYSGLYYRI